MLAPTDRVTVLLTALPLGGVAWSWMEAVNVTPNGAKPAALVWPVGGVAPVGRDAFRVLSPMYQEMRSPALVAAEAAVWPLV